MNYTKHLEYGKKIPYYFKLSDLMSLHYKKHSAVKNLSKNIVFHEYSSDH